MPENNHVFLINQKSNNPKFKRKRGRKNSPDAEPIQTPQPKFIKQFQKEGFRSDALAYYSQKKARALKREIKFPKYIDLIRIHFLTICNADLIKKFEQKYGLSPVAFSHYNKTVIFEILDDKMFLNFEAHIKQVIESPEETPYDNQPFNLISLILKFEFLGSSYRYLTFRERGILLTLISSSNTIYKEQKEKLLEFLAANAPGFTYHPEMPDIIEIAQIDKVNSSFIADNFDIVRMITSTRPLKLRPGMYGDVRREFGFQLNVPDNLPVVGIIDTGISRIEPLNDIIIGTAFDHTGQGAFWDESGHGTMVAGLVAIGDEFHASIKELYTAKAKLLAIKALHFENDDLNIPQLLKDIRVAKQNLNVRIFNMSLNMPSAKLYNDTYSQFSYELDKLAYEEDILIFISVGNFDSNSLNDLVNVDIHPDHDYPTFFYNLNPSSQVHRCQNTNISEPAESLNNVSVGALAGNLEDSDKTDITPNNLSPAYYTRKFHMDYTQSVNKRPLQKNQNNKHLNKPDLVFDGGDLFAYEAGIEILRTPLSSQEKYYGRSCGTSLAAPLVASYAAEILHKYSNLKTQTIKALLINSAAYHKKQHLPHFKSSTDASFRSLVGFGKPQKKNLLVTDDNSIVFVIEDEIEAAEIISIPIAFPEYLKNSGNKLKCDVTLAYSFLPVKDNHLNYLPLYMAFNLILNKDIKTIAEKDQDEYGIKKGFSWSEDHHGIENRIFSNAQHKSYNLQPDDLITVDDSIALAIRCLTKEDISATHVNHLKTTKHKFSIVLRLTELIENKASNNLYSEMIACNDISMITEADGDAIIELEN